MINGGSITRDPSALPDSAGIVSDPVTLSAAELAELPIPELGKMLRRLEEYIDWFICVCRFDANIRHISTKFIFAILTVYTDIVGDFLTQV